MKRILLYLENFLRGGLERRIVNLANRFAESGYSVDILVDNRLEPERYFEINKDVRIISFKTGMVYSPVRKSSELGKEYSAIEIADTKSSVVPSLKRENKKSGFYEIKEKINKISIIEHFNYRKNYRRYFVNADIVIAFEHRMYARAYYATRGINCHLIVATASPHDYSLPTWNPESKKLIKLLKKSNSIIVQTIAEKEYFDKICKSVFVINNPVRPDLPMPYKGKRNKVIVNFCRISKQKNLELLINAFYRFQKEHSDYLLKIYGLTVFKSEYVYKEKLIKLINDLDLSKKVSIEPPREDIHEAVIDSAMFVSSSDYEGLSNSMLEAMAIGLPCICTDCIGGGTREVMINRENGLIVPMRDTDTMSCAMKEFAENSELSEKCSRNAAMIREKLSADRIAKQWLNTINELI